jgi:hypothetical protein
MLVKVNGYDFAEHIVKVTQLDIDNYGSIIPVKELELRLPTNDDSVLLTLRNSTYAAVFTGIDDDNSTTIILASSITNDELNEEKRKTIYAANKGMK